MKKFGNLIVVVIMVVALVATLSAFILTRGGDWAERFWSFENSRQTAFSLVTEQKKLISDLNILKAAYAQKVVDYQSELAKITKSTEFSEVERAERRAELEKYYSKEYFEDLLLKIENTQKLIARVEKQMCRFTCEDILD